MADDVTVEEQATIMKNFLDGLVDAFEYEASISEERIDDETIELRVEGSDLGLLIGPKGQTLQAVQELARTVVQRHASGTHHGRVRIDVAGYRQRRREALERFTKQVAADVVASGKSKALEPMHPADRKVVHDVVNELDGVSTTSEGEEPRRRVVIVPVVAAAVAEES
jgi:spoIIIJ-associated protein